MAASSISYCLALASSDFSLASASSDFFFSSWASLAFFLASNSASRCYWAISSALAARLSRVLRFNSLCYSSSLADFLTGTSSPFYSASDSLAYSLAYSSFFFFSNSCFFFSSSFFCFSAKEDASFCSFWSFSSYFSSAYYGCYATISFLSSLMLPLSSDSRMFYILGTGAFMISSIVSV